MRRVMRTMRAISMRKRRMKMTMSLRKTQRRSRARTGMSLKGRRQGESPWTPACSKPRS